MWQQMEDGINPFETWMLANGYSQETIDQIYQIIDRWLVKTGPAISHTPYRPDFKLIGLNVLTLQCDRPGLVVLLQGAAKNCRLYVAIAPHYHY